MGNVKLIRALLLLLLLIVTLTAIIAGIDFMIYSNGLLFGLPPAILAYTPFSNFFIPGLISLLFVGGSSLAALILSIDKNLYALPAALVSGSVLLICVSLASFIFKNILWIEVLYWAIGLKTIVLALYLQKKYDELKVEDGI